MPKYPDKTIQIFDDHVLLITGSFTFKSPITPERDINACVASCIEKVANGKLTGVEIKDNRS